MSDLLRKVWRVRAAGLLGLRANLPPSNVRESGDADEAITKDVRRCLSLCR